MIKLSNKKWVVAGITFLLIFHIVGLIGFSMLDTRPLFRSLSVFHLMISAFLVFSFHNDWNRPFYGFLFLAFGAGMLVEVIGVSTGYPFGEYFYGKSLGIKLYGVPIIIGMNWVLLIYTTGSIADQWIPGKVWKILVASTLMVLIDIPLEPITQKLDFWYWKQHSIPWSNFLSWWIISALLHTVFFNLPFSKKNPVSLVYYGVSIVFFTLLNVLL